MLTGLHYYCCFVSCTFILPISSPTLSEAKVFNRRSESNRQTLVVQLCSRHTIYIYSVQLLVWPMSERWVQMGSNVNSDCISQFHQPNYHVDFSSPIINLKRKKLIKHFIKKTLITSYTWRPCTVNKGHHLFYNPAFRRNLEHHCFTSFLLTGSSEKHVLVNRLRWTGKQWHRTVTV